MPGKPGQAGMRPAAHFRTTTYYSHTFLKFCSVSVACMLLLFLLAHYPIPVDKVLVIFAFG
jgi:hypothetical protein